VIGVARSRISDGVVAAPVRVVRVFMLSSAHRVAPASGLPSSPVSLQTDMLKVRPDERIY
jgi:hypothetical protein